MKVCVLNDRDWGGFDPAPYLIGYEWEMIDIEKANIVTVIRDIMHRNFDVVLNLVDGAWDEDRPGIEVIRVLEQYNIPFTGADTNFYEPTREMMKQVAHFYNIKSAAGVFVSRIAQLKKMVSGMRYPLLVKHPNSYGSIALKKENRVESFEKLKERAEWMIDQFGGTLIEEFIEGREFSVLVSENLDDAKNPYAYHPVEIRFPEGESFKHEDMKWINYEQMKFFPVEDAELAERIKDMGRKMFVGLNGAGYGRCDIRMSETTGDLFLLEINPNCGVFYNPNEPGTADFILQYDSVGHRGFVQNLFRAALARAQSRQRTWDVRYKPNFGYGMVAARKIKEGEIIESFEQKNHVLISKAKVLKEWEEARRQIFFQHAYPISDDIWVMWDQDPQRWSPVNHSCDPNAWLIGLDLVARHDIAFGEEINIEYATLYGEDMPSFECHCGSNNCRGLISGMDYLEPLIENFEDHISPYIRAKRNELKVKFPPRVTKTAVKVPAKTYVRVPVPSIPQEKEDE